MGPRRVGLLAVLGLWAVGCVAHRPRHFEVGPPEKALVAAREACDRLGWTSRMAGENLLLVSDHPDAPSPSWFAKPLEVRVEQGLLRVDAPDPENAPQPSAVPGFLAEATRQVLAGEALPQGQPGARKSTLLTLALDFALPTAAALYALSDNPYVEAGPWNRGRGINVLTRSMLDGMGLLLLATQVYSAAIGQPLDVMLLVVAIEALVLNRLTALAIDLRAVFFQQRLAESGLHLGAPLQPRAGVVPGG